MLDAEIESLCKQYFTLLKSNNITPEIRQVVKDIVLQWLKLRTFLVISRKNRGKEEIQTRILDIIDCYNKKKEDLDIEFTNYAIYKPLIKKQDNIFKFGQNPSYNFLD